MTADAAAFAIAALRSDPVFFIAQLLVFAKISLLLLVLDPSAADAFSLPKSTAGHAATYVLLVAFAYLVARHPVAVLRVSPAHVAVAVVLVLFAVATPFAIAPSVAAFGASRRYLGLTQMADNAVLYVAAVALFPTVRDLARLFVATAAATIPVVAYAIAQRLGLDPVTYGISTVGRASTTLGQPDIAGGFLSIAAVTMAAVLIFRWRSIGRIAGASLAILTVATLAALYFTGSRAGLLGLAGGAFGIVALAFLRPGADRRRILGAATGLAVLALLAVSLTPLGSRLRPDVLTKDQSLLSRLEIWDTALRAVAQHPILGLGPDNFAAIYPALRSERSFFLSPGVLENSTHNWFLYFLTSGGPVAALAIVALIAFVLATTIVLARGADPRALVAVPLLAYLGQGLVNVNDLGLDWVLWLSAGALVSAAARPIGARLRPATYSSAAALAVVVFLVALYGAYVSRDRVMASEYFGREEVLSNAVQGLAAVEAARQAVAIDPRRAEYWSGFGRALLVAGNPGAAAQGFQEAADREPWQPVYWRNVALAKLSNADARGTVAALHRAIDADVFDADSHALLARISYNTGDYVAALREGQTTVHLEPEKVDEYEAPFRAALALNRLQDAVDLLRYGVAHTDSNALRDELAQVYDAQGHRDQALALVHEVLARDPLDGVALQLLDRYTKP